MKNRNDKEISYNNFLQSHLEDTKGSDLVIEKGRRKNKLLKAQFLILGVLFVLIFSGGIYYSGYDLDLEGNESQVTNEKY